MKRIIVDLVAIVLLTLILSQTVYAQSIFQGDVDNDGSVTISDLATVLANFGSQDSGVKSIVKVTVHFTSGYTDTPLSQAKVVVRNHGTDEILGQGFTDSSGKSPEWLIGKDTTVDVYAYPPESSQWSQNCGDIWTVNTGPYGTTQSQLLRVTDSSANPCIQDKICMWNAN